MSNGKVADPDKMRELARRAFSALGETVPAHPDTTLDVMCSLGIEDERVAFRVGDTLLMLTAEQADELSTDLRTYAIELRNGGRLG